MPDSCFKSKSERAAAFEASDLYVVISSEFTLGRPVMEIFEAAASTGVTLIQLREKEKGKKFLYDLAVACRPVANRHGVLLMIDDHVDVALAAGADGVHLGQEDLPIEAARAIAPELWLGNSTHNLEEALAARRAGADYINIGPIYPTRTKSIFCGALGVEAIRRIAPQVNLPFSVMGGIKAAQIPELLAAGARHIAMVTEVTQAPDVVDKVRELRALFRT